MSWILALLAAVVLSACGAMPPRGVSMIQQVKGKDWIPLPNGSGARNATAVGDYALLDAGGQIGGLWAYAEYTAPVTPHELPSEINIYLADLTGSYYISIYHWQDNRWYSSGPYTQLSITLPTGSAFWAVHVYGSDKVTVLESALETVAQ